MAKKDCTVWQASNWSSLGFARVVCLLGVCLFHICSLHADTRQFWAHAFWGAGVEERFLGRSDAVLHSGGGVEGLIRSGFGVVLEAGYFSGAEGETGGWVALARSFLRLQANTTNGTIR